MLDLNAILELINAIIALLKKVFGLIPSNNGEVDESSVLIVDEPEV